MDADRPFSPGTLLRDLLACLRFYSRLAIPQMRFEAAAHALPDFSRCIRMLPFAGILIALPAAVVFVIAGWLALPPFVAAAFSVAAMALATGCFHEDGLADIADGFGGGRTRERKLEIMKDSRIGTFGGVALALALILRIALLAAVLERFGLGAAFAAILAVAGVSRVVGLLPLTLLPPARADGVARAVQAPSRRLVVATLALSVILSAVLMMPLGIGFLRLCVACFAAVVSGFYMVRLARRHLDGQTGDVAGATQQVAEIAFLTALIALPHAA
ncbi:adenosylcobinamide-GDP ribazoletransferase [Methylovirgula sp. 4M-Z18]|uniref:adenosylcobinamide-GDP ribazoletransferase n=1 Tax=Methylovirgula sp. 4M-Z18 TaxID=2293567 RepID=UPI000E2F04F2|nr:adenosylcobinamide-GDP ribazoletransferase [Methylovirgula sp. 4M-Z18]RFB79883.1 adenosylcobinamide-GDP ribazoletransferase [Methylovirgula sp. 4M-Z18]